jgi:peptidoglycan/LPS O-acetylase OafA/YrhL
MSVATLHPGSNQQTLPQPAGVQVVDAPAPANSGQPRLHQLDGLRAIAVLLVMIHHCGAASLAGSLAEHGHRYLAELIKTFTASGVELFFVLSGAVMLRPYLRHARQFRRLNYLERRVERLWPPFVAAWVVSGAVIFLISHHPTWWSRTAELPHFTFSSWAAQLGIIYWGHGPYNFAWWSLTVEALFYLLVPFVGTALVLSHATYRRMLLAVFVAAALAVCAQNVAIDLPQWAIPLRSFALYLSCFAAGIFLARYDLTPRWRIFTLGFGVAYCLASFRFRALDVHVGYGSFYLGVMGIALANGRMGRWLGAEPFVWLGERSYSLFLVHFAVFTAVCYAVSLCVTGKGATYGILTRIIELPLALLAAMMIFHWVERRFARGLVTADRFWPSKRNQHSD